MKSAGLVRYWHTGLREVCGFRPRLEAGEMAGSFPDDYYILENDMPRFTIHLADSNTF